MTAGNHLGIEAQAPGRAVARARGVGGAHREAVDARAVEGRHVDRRHHVGGEHAAQGLRERDRLGGERREIEMLVEAAARLRHRDDLEKLLLTRRLAHRGDEAGSFCLVRVRHGSGLISTSAPAP